MTLSNRDIPMPYEPGAQLLRESWQAIGITLDEKKLNSDQWTVALAAGNFGNYTFDKPAL